MEKAFFHKLILVSILVVALGVTIYITKKIIRLYIIKNSIEPHRRKLILNLSYLAYYLLALFFLLLIFDFKVKEIGVFASSILAVLGVGFFAQWSILSNLTASVILFFYHPMRIGDTIRIIDKEYDFVGEVKNITGLFVLLHIAEGNREITIPNTTILYKGIELINQNKKR